MAKFMGAIPGLLKREGGVANLKNDRGGLTNLGISMRSHPEMTREEILALTPKTAAPMYKRETWDPLQLPGVKSDAIATVIFDFAVHSGNMRAAIEAQRVLGIVDDGIIGPKSLAALNSCDEKFFVKSYLLERVEYLNLLAKRKSQRGFLHSWINRIGKLRADLRSRRLVH